MKKNMIGWFEIPVKDMKRAIHFYETVFGVTLQLHDFGEVQMAWFPEDEGGSGSSGSLVYNPQWYIPNFKEGPLLYFKSEDVKIELDRIEALGARILKPKTKISDEIGYMGLFHDSEGNRIALFSKK